MPSKGTSVGFLKDSIGNFLGGIDGGVDPHLLTKNKLAWSVNSTVRGGFIGPMPKSIACSFSDGGILIIGGTDTVSHFVQNGLYQGSTPKAYQPNGSSVLPGPTFFSLISGRLFGFTPDFLLNPDGTYSSSSGMVAVKEYTINNAGVPDLNSATATQAWLGQAENYMIVQDGVTQNPLIFDGTNTFRSYKLQQTVATFSAGTTLIAPTTGGVIIATPTTDITTISSEFFNIPVGVFAPSGGIPAGTSPVTPAYAGNEYIGNMALAIVPPSTGGAVLTSAATGTVKTGDTIYLESTTYPSAVNSTTVSTSYPILYSTSLLVNTADANNAQQVSGYVDGSMTALVTVAQYAYPAGSTIENPMAPTGKTTIVTSNAITASMISSGSFNIPMPSDPYGKNSRVTAIKLNYVINGTTGIVAFTAIGTIGGTSLTYNFPATGTSVVLAGSASYPTSSTQGATVYVGDNSDDPSANLICTISSPSTATEYYLTNNSIVENVPLTNCVIKTLAGIPCGKAWAYSQGRIWTSLANGTQFIAGNNVGSSTGTAANNFLDAILYTTQNDLLSNGGTFSIPGNFGKIAAMVVAPVLNVQLGQGPLQVFTPQCVFSVNAPADMTTWAASTTPIVTVSLIGSGGVSQWAAIQVNGDIIARSHDGIRSLTIASLDFYKWNNTLCGNEVDRAIQDDNDDLLNWCSEATFDNRVIVGSSPINGVNGVYFQNAVAMNLDTVSNLQTKSPAVWESQWTGLNALQWMTGVFGNNIRCFYFTSNGTTIGLSELLKTKDGQDVLGATKTTWQFESALLFAGNESSGDYNLLRLEDGEIYVRNIIGDVDFTVEFRSDYDTLWHTWYSWSVSNSDFSKPYFVRMGLGNPIGGASVSGSQYRDGYNFQLRVTVNGSANFMGGMFKASIVSQSEFARPIVSTAITPVTSVVTLKQVFTSLGPPTNQNPGGPGLCFDSLNEEFYLWLGTQWETGITPSGATIIVNGRQAFAGSGSPTAATPTPAGNAGTYFDYTNKAIVFWNPAGYWGDDFTAVGSGIVANTLGSDYFYGHGAPTIQVPANNAGIYYDLDDLTVYNWNPITKTWI